MVTKLEVKKLTDADYNLYCVSCGSTNNVQMFPHRNERGGMVGLIFYCSKCAHLAPGTVCKYEFQEPETESKPLKGIPKFGSAIRNWRKA